ncbi:hypothetical protein FNH22_18730 [Fulvivirga sp. M361]|uniref:hypothetical protein n=1 Tax=Fulvivirga sp. M361 TaxID=2594266 RepID=UPI001179CA53|nr:hypothetical protein [Fulvivirga sp. M361]TRX54797.1 hypothetical protein FNH22_18730 [Fulvivirga sp. M361]
MEIRGSEKKICRNRVTIPNPLLHQVLTYIVVLIFCCVTIVSCIWVVILVKTEGVLSIGGIPVIIFFAGYSSYIGLLILRYRTARVAYDDNCFTVTQGGNSTSYIWSEIMKTKYHGMFQVLKLLNAKGKTIYTIHGITRDNKKFIQKIGKTAGFTIDVF